ncbi:hypothetical protein [Micromonospora narathiwatensis]|uniref:hypothetical protein n=1 Tax=Micromonospora narathiwatensis TaxID=299146 RepID=UPI00143101A9|nr:hypothetical protein [Micromonospora narathiwatensis]
MILENLRTHERYEVILVGSDKMRLRSSGGPIDRSFAHFELRQRGQPLLEVWTDIEILTLSHHLRRGELPPQRGDCHELDIVILPAGIKSGYPPHDLVRMAVECKNTAFQKHMMRAALGVRRELSYLKTPRPPGPPRPGTRPPTSFSIWPRRDVAADPASVLAVYSTDPTVSEYDKAGQVFGVDFIHEPM